MPPCYRSTTLTNTNTATRNIFVAKLDSSSGAVLWANGYGTTNDDWGFG
jgi:hypothetical protein